MSVTKKHFFHFVLCQLKACDTGNQKSYPDEEHNRKTVLLMLITMILYSSPVCEKQALFAIFQCIKKNGLDPQLVRKVITELKKLSSTTCSEYYSTDSK